MMWLNICLSWKQIKICTIPRWNFTPKTGIELSKTVVSFLLFTWSFSFILSYVSTNLIIFGRNIQRIMWIYLTYALQVLMDAFCILCDPSLFNIIFILQVLTIAKATPRLDQTGVLCNLYPSLCFCQAKCRSLLGGSCDRIWKRHFIYSKRASPVSQT